MCNGGAIHKMGSIEEGTTISDYREYEIRNQHSISLSLMNIEWLESAYFVKENGALKLKVLQSDDITKENSTNSE